MACASHTTSPLCEDHMQSRLHMRLEEEFIRAVEIMNILSEVQLSLRNMLYQAFGTNIYGNLS